jgi:hypothetical protein
MRIHILLCGALSSALLTGAATAPQLALDHVVTVDHSFKGEQVPHWASGFLVRIDGNRTAAPTLVSYDRSGRELSAVMLTIDQSRIITVFDWAAGREGVVVACGGAYDDSGRGGGFFAILDPSSRSERVVRLSPYYPHRIAMAPDGTIWTSGEETVNGREHGPGVDFSHGVLRHFDATGHLISSVIPRSTLENRLMAGEGFLNVGVDGRVGWYTGPVGGVGSAYFEISPSGETTRFDPLPLLEHDIVRGIALPDSGGTIISINSSPGNWSLWRASSNRSWNQLQLPPSLSGTNSDGLLGSDGDFLVFKKVAYTMTLQFVSLPGNSSGGSR